MNQDVAISISSILSPWKLWHLYDEMVEWLDGKEFKWVALRDSCNFDSLPQQVKALLIVEMINHEGNFMIYLDN